MNNSIFPLAEKLRPSSLEECEGQDHIIGKGKILSSFIENKKVGSLIFWGPPGTGKTTVSRILVQSLGMTSVEFSATISGIGEIRDIMSEAIKVKSLDGRPLVVFVDEIHHFNKHSQDAFLPFVERGDIILIGTTIENPAYKINRALLSRLKVLEFYPLNRDHLVKILKKAVSFLKKEAGIKLTLNQETTYLILDYCTGDARRLLNLVEIVANIRQKGQKIDRAFIQEIIQKKIGAYDRQGDDRYQLISALHKSIRNSDCDASLYWLHRMLEGGEDPLYIIRRMIRIAGEDIGLADTEALKLCLEVKDAYEYLGSPEGDLFLTQAVIYLASAPKSNSVYKTEALMKKIINSYGNLPVPVHLVNPADFLSARKGAGKGYLYAHDFKEKTTDMRTLPEAIKEQNFFIPQEIGYEKKIKERLLFWKKIKAGFKGKKM
jgi:putative ATPase